MSNVRQLHSAAQLRAISKERHARALDDWLKTGNRRNLHRALRQIRELDGQAFDASKEENRRLHAKGRR